MASPPDSSSRPATSSRVRALRALQAVVTLGAFAYLYALVDRQALVRAVASLSLVSFGIACALVYLTLAVGVMRWRLLLSAFAAPHPPRIGSHAKYYLAGLFYNTYLPGAVAGDVVRGLASRAAFGEGGVANALAVVLVERVLGLTAVLFLTAGTSMIHPLRGAPAAWIFGVLGLFASSAAVLGLLLARRLSTVVPPKLARVLRMLPVPARFLPLWTALFLSVLGQLIAALAGYVLIDALVPNAKLLDALVIVPLALAAAFVPVTMAGLGARETAFDELYALVGVPSEHALAASLAMLLLTLVVAATGGLWVLLSPIDTQTSPKP